MICLILCCVFGLAILRLIIKCYLARQTEKYIKSLSPSTRFFSHVYDHEDAFSPLHNTAWSIVGTNPGMALNRTMTVFKLEDDTLAIHSAIALSEPLMREMEEWGTPSVLIVPNAHHRRDAAVYKERYPGILVVCPARALKAVEKVVHVDATLEEITADCSAPEVLAGVIPVAPFRDSPEWLFVCPDPESSEVAVVWADLIFNLETFGWSAGLGGRIMDFLGSTGSFKVTSIGRFFLGKQRAQFACFLCDLATGHHIGADEVFIPTPTVLVPAHGDGIYGEDACMAALWACAERLIPGIAEPFVGACVADSDSDVEEEEEEDAPEGEDEDYVPPAEVVEDTESGELTEEEKADE